MEPLPYYKQSEYNTSHLNHSAQNHNISKEKRYYIPIADQPVDVFISEFHYFIVYDDGI